MMGKEKGTPATPQTPKRTTRSSSTTPSKHTLRTPKTSDPVPPSTSSDLLFSEKSISLDNLLSSFPGRRLQILELLRLIGPLNSPMIPFLIYGGVSTGKTSVILQIFKHLNRPFVYSSCRSCYNPRILFESVLNKLLAHQRNASNGYSSAKRCEKVADFVNLLKEALIRVIDGINGCSKKSGLKETMKQGSGRMVYLIFDNVELLRAWDKNSSMISTLFNISDILKMPEVGLIFISGTSPDTYYSNTGFPDPLPVFFPDYTEDDLYQIFMRNQANPKLYSSFLDAVLKPFCRITRRINELSIALSPLYQKYCEPLSDMELVPDENTKRRLFSHLQPHITNSLNQIFKVPSRPSLEVNKEKVKRKGNMTKLAGGEGCNELDFHMSISAKYLLISAFLASRNPATLDAALFDSTGGGDNRKRKRKSSATSIEKTDNAAQEMLMKGPGTFPLERLLAIFQCITSVAEGYLKDDQQSVSVMEGMDVGGLMSDVLLQLSTLCNANFISKGKSCPLEGSSRYRSTVDEEMALKVARSVNFPLSKYLYRR
ncbi:origin of replication complex subunit 5 [Magnolia sinica]|uniref:origin of replication complex subunit 5 n=1 Tax=Magnolia sinica TaxID=86752 RepID=UPI0026595F17|nr:origin of replication complex subunit 5 [Magnolia sinica]XP_058073600.1 origin of replication complex subunit 5 [Magnolia sinica]